MSLVGRNADEVAIPRTLAGRVASERVEVDPPRAHVAPVLEQLVRPLEAKDRHERLARLGILG